MSSRPAERPKEPAKRPAHHLHRGLAHHRAHRVRVREQAQAHHAAAVRQSDQSNPGGKP